jgi:hypothetical protein
MSLCLGVFLSDNSGPATKSSKPNTIDLHPLSLRNTQILLDFFDLSFANRNASMKKVDMEGLKKEHAR